MVILDVVYNHRAESDHLGPTLSFRGLDNAAYYRLQPGHKRFYVNDTGCGNTLNLAHPHVLRLVLVSLRWLVEAMGVDGFRFALSTPVRREAHRLAPPRCVLDRTCPGPPSQQTERREGGQD